MGAYRETQRQQALAQAEALAGADALPEVADEQPEQPAATDPQARVRVAAEAFEQLPPEAKAAVREALQSEVQRVEAAKQQYEQGLAALYQQHQASALGEFYDIFAAPNPAAALAEMRAQNPERAQRFDQQKRVEQAYFQEQQRVHQINAQQQQQQFAQWAAQQDAAVQSLVPELAADEPQRAAFQKASVEALEARGFTKAELYAAWQGQPFSMRDARVQAIVADATRWRNAQASSKNIVTHAKPLPPVQRPGVSRTNGHAAENLESLSRRVDRAGSHRAASWC